MLEQLNWIAIGLATLVSMAIGAAWYSVLARQWIAACGFSEEQIRSIDKNDTPIIYIIAAASHLVMAIVLSGIVFHVGGSQISAGDGMLSGVLVWLGFVFTSVVHSHQHAIGVFHYMIICYHVAIFC